MRPANRIWATAVLAAMATLLGITANADDGDTTRVSVSSDGTQGNDSSVYPQFSADGRYVAFGSLATNLVPGDTNSRFDVFVRDTQTAETIRVSVAGNGTEGNDESRGASVSADGRYVAFHSYSSNLVPGDTNGVRDVFVHDTVSGETTRVSLSSDEEERDHDSVSPSISADGRYVAYSYVTPVSDEHDTSEVFVHDTENGETTRVSVASTGDPGDGSSESPSISADGRYVAFYSDASNLVPGDSNGTGDVFAHDTENGETTRVSLASDGTEGNDWSGSASISANGRYVAFSSSATNLIPDDTNDTTDIFVHDKVSGDTTRVSVASDWDSGDDVSVSPSVSADGRFVAFRSFATNLVPDDTNDVVDVFVRDTVRGETTRVSVASDGTQGNDWSEAPFVSADGRYVTFHSDASNLIPGDTNGRSDVFVHHVPVDHFTDDDGHLFEDDINAIADAGITRGCNPPDNDHYCPDESFLRGQAAAFLRRALNVPASDTNHFTDDDNSVFEGDINANATEGITLGCNPPDNTLFCPDDPFTRGQAAAFVRRALNVPATDTDHFTDDASSIFEADINAIAEAGITRGCNPPDNDRYCPNDLLTRGQAAAFMRRALLP